MPGERDVNAVDVILLQKKLCFLCNKSEKIRYAAEKRAKGGSRLANPSPIGGVCRHKKPIKEQKRA